MFKFKTCDQVFNHGNKKVTTDMKERISMLYNTCVLSQHLDGDVEFHFRNGIEVKQSRTGQTQ